MRATYPASAARRPPRHNKLTPRYQFAIVKRYIEAKLERGKTPAYTADKLSKLEQSADQSTGPAFVLAREYFGFPRSKVFAHTQVPPQVLVSAPPEVPPPAYKPVDSAPARAPAHATAHAPAPAVPIPEPAAPVMAAGLVSNSVPVPVKRGKSDAGSRLSSMFDRLTTSSSGEPSSSTLAAPPSPVSRSGASSPASIVVNGEHALEMLRDFDTAFIIDDSSSMTGRRWEQARAAVKGVVGQACKYDDDGVDIYFLNAKRDSDGVRRPADVDNLFRGLQPRGTTPTGKTLERILRDYMRKLETATDRGKPDSVKPLNIIVITDGAPTDDPESVIVTYAKRLDRGDYPLSQVGIQFFQVGNDPEATKALQELDDELGEQHGIRDMVDTVPYSGDLDPDVIVKVLLGGINRRLDRKK